MANLHVFKLLHSRNYLKREKDLVIVYLKKAFNRKGTNVFRYVIPMY